MTAMCIVFLIAQNVLRKQFNLRCVKGEITFSAISSCFALLFFVITTKNIGYEWAVLPYSCAFAASYALCNVMGVLALRNGSLAITTLIMSYSLVIPTVYGLLFLHEKAGILQYLGIACLLVSLFLIRKKQEEKEEEKKVSFRWAMYVLIAFFTNGMCSVIQNMQQRRFEGVHNGNFMIVALLLSAASLLVFALAFERKQMLTVVKKGAVFAAAVGTSNGALNLFVMLTVATMAASVFFPLLSAGQIVFTFLLSVLVFKEKFMFRQIIGLACGIVALVLLNI